MTAPRFRLRHTRHRSRGQSLAEFALVFPILMLVLGGIIQFGIIFWGQNTLTQIARDTGRWAATQTACANGTGAGQADVLGTAKALAGQSSLIGASSSWTYGTGATDNVLAEWSVVPAVAPAPPATCPPVDNTMVAYVKITIRHRVPVFFPFVPGDGNLTTFAQFRMEPHP
jgi:Flp pilus assembly protein TadG